MDVDTEIRLRLPGSGSCVRAEMLGGLVLVLVPRGLGGL